MWLVWELAEFPGSVSTVVVCGLMWNLLHQISRHQKIQEVAIWVAIVSQKVMEEQEIVGTDQETEEKERRKEKVPVAVRRTTEEVDPHSSNQVEP